MAPSDALQLYLDGRAGAWRPRAPAGAAPSRDGCAVKLERPERRARLEAMRASCSRSSTTRPKDTGLVGVPDPLIVGPAAKVHEDDEDPARFFPSLDR